MVTGFTHYLTIKFLVNKTSCPPLDLGRIFRRSFSRKNIFQRKYRLTIGIDIRADGGDPLLTLRQYRQLAPWNLKDLVAVSGAALFSSSVKPINAAAAQLPSQRTVRFYVTRRLVAPPEGKGTSATYHYRHLLQVLFIKSRQMEGATLTTIAGEIGQLTGDVLERRVASAIGTELPAPASLPLRGSDSEPSGRTGRIFRGIPDAHPDDRVSENPASWIRLEICPGIELHLRDDHPFVRNVADMGPISESVLLALSRVSAESQ
jgi:hypothetical protein